MSVQLALARLRKEAEYLAEIVPGTSWFLFGSALVANSSPNDIDVLVIYKEDGHAKLIRDHLRTVFVVPPIHLILMRNDEEEELQFKSGERCAEFYPGNGRV